MVDLGNEDEIIAAFVHKEGLRFLLASKAGRGFIARAEDLLAEKRTGKNVLTVEPPDRLFVVTDVEGDSVAVIGDNRKLLVFPLEQVPEMSRGRGVTLQGYKDGGLSDVKVFRRADGLTWQLGGRTRTETALSGWVGNRAGAARCRRNGFPKSNSFDG